MQAMESGPCKPKIWKHYVHNTFSILDRESVNSFLQHFNSQQPSICFTMETKNNRKIAFLDTSVCREPDGCFTTSVYRKPAHTDHSIVKCLYVQAKCLVTKLSVISEEKKHLYLFLADIPPLLCTKTRTALRREPMAEFKPTTISPYIQRVLEPLHC